MENLIANECRSSVDKGLVGGIWNLSIGLGKDHVSIYNYFTNTADLVHPQVKVGHRCTLASLAMSLTSKNFAPTRSSHQLKLTTQPLVIKADSRC